MVASGTEASSFATAVSEAEAGAEFSGLEDEVDTVLEVNLLMKEKISLHSCRERQRSR